jgi:hypothetical protein
VRRTIVFVGIVVCLGSSCRSESSLAPVSDVSVTVDSAVYHLKGSGGSYRITLTATVANQGNDDVYLSRSCPETDLRRPDDTMSRLEFGQTSCEASGSSLAPTLTLSPGATYTESFTLYGSLQPQATPKTTMQDLTGPAIFEFFVISDSKFFQPAKSAPFLLEAPS